MLKWAKSTSTKKIKDELRTPEDRPTKDIGALKAQMKQDAYSDETSGKESLLIKNEMRRESNVDAKEKIDEQEKNVAKDGKCKKLVKPFIGKEKKKRNKKTNAFIQKNLSATQEMHELRERDREILTVEKTFKDRFKFNQKQDDAFYEVFEAACAAGKEWKKKRVELIQNSLPQQINMKDEVGETMLHIAAEHGLLIAVEVLIASKAQTNIYNSRGWTPFHVAVANSRFDTVKKLHELGADLHIREKALEYTPAHIAAFSDDIEMLKLLVLLGTDLSLVAKNGYTVLHTAAQRDSRRCIEYLLSLNVKKNAVDTMGETAAHKAARAGHMISLNLLREAGSSMYIENWEEDNVLHVATCNTRYTRKSGSDDA